MTQAEKRYYRFSIFERIEHLVLLISFTTLAVTGIPQKYVLWPISQWIIQVLGGIETTRIIHHVAAAVFLVEAVYHLVEVFYKIYVQRKQASMLPGIKDGMDAIQWFGFNLGMVKKHPKMPRYNFMEKAEYWALLWGLIVMALTGLAMWNPIATTNFLPGEFIPAAKSAHGGEAVLAVLAIILWHFYNVHIKHWNWGMIKGTISRSEMAEEHGEELEAIETGKLPEPVSPAVQRQRLAFFIPSAAVVSLALLAVTYYFLTFETTSITTIPPAERAQVFVPQTPTPVPTPAPTATSAPKPTTLAGEAEVVVWDGGVNKLFKDKCSTCHGKAGGFNAESYAEVVKAVKPGSPDDSMIVKVQSAGGHPGQFSSQELNQVIQWIQDGALEKPSGASSPAGAGESAAASETWSSGIQDMLSSQCKTCHGKTGGFTATSYDEVMKQVTPGDPDQSKIVEVQKAGGHPGQLSDADLARLIQWIQAGAPK